MSIKSVQYFGDTQPEGGLAALGQLVAAMWSAGGEGVAWLGRGVIAWVGQGREVSN